MNDLTIQCSIMNLFTKWFGFREYFATTNNYRFTYWVLCPPWYSDRNAISNGRMIHKTKEQL